ncbi:MAG: 50S ribosomal protein L11 methyltransferase [Candidatus Aminicenantes bacterium]|nr:50S ribosomal protein L11 methyltransferase [Candidatus Aminicenantes bacterium]
MGMEIGEKFVIVSSFEESETSTKIPLILGPGWAFGSGEHETTRSCLEELGKLPVESMESVLDLGCGTGILGIAAAKMGAQSVTAVDPNPFAIQTTISNIKLNSLDNRVRIIQGELKDVKGVRFDLIMANLYGDVLLEIVQDIPLFLKPNGFLLLSGIHYEYHYEIKTAFLEMGLRLLRNRMLEEYCTFLFRK